MIKYDQMHIDDLRFMKMKQIQAVKKLKNEISQLNYAIANKEYQSHKQNYKKDIKND